MTFIFFRGFKPPTSHGSGYAYARPRWFVKKRLQGGSQILIDCRSLESLRRQRNFVWWVAMEVSEKCLVRFSYYD